MTIQFLFSWIQSGSISLCSSLLQEYRFQIIINRYCKLHKQKCSQCDIFRDTASGHITVVATVCFERRMYLEYLHGPSMFAVNAKIYGVLYNQASLIAFNETSSYWSALKRP